jgi:hypothetical protein
LVRSLVTQSRASKLLGPPDAVAFDGCFVACAAMPKAAIDKHRDARGYEHEIRVSPYVIEHSPMNSVTKAQGEEGTPQVQLARGVPTCLGSHLIANSP